MNCYIDIGGTNIRVNFKSVTQTFKTNSLDPQKNLIKISNIIKSKKFNKIFLAFPGPANFKKGIIYNPPNLKGWWNLNIKNELSIKTNIDVKNIICKSDSKMMALSNHNEFKNSENDVSLFFTISTGIGSAVIINNEVYEGNKGNAGEIGMLPIILKKNLKDIKNLEYWCSGKGLSKISKEHGIKNIVELFNQWHLKNYKAEKIIKDSIEVMSFIVSIGISFFDPNIVIFDGAISRNQKIYMKKLIKNIEKIISIYNHNKVNFKISNQDDFAVINGLKALGVKK